MDRMMEQPEIIAVNEYLRLRKYDGNYRQAIAWYRDPVVYRGSEGITDPERVPDENYIEGMYRWLSEHGECYWIEALEDGTFVPIGDITVKAENMPIVIGAARWRGRGVGKMVMEAAIRRAREMGFPKLYGSEVYDFNTASQRLHESLGFRRVAVRGNTWIYELDLSGISEGAAAMVGIEELGRRAKDASRIIGRADTAQKNRCLEAIAEALWAERETILAANGADVAVGRENGLSDGLIDRLTLSEERIQGICEGVRKLVQLDDPVGIIESGTVRPNGLRIEKVRVPMGAVGIIYESRPNVTVDGATLCLKSGNAALLRGGKEAIRSNMVLAGVMRQALEQNGLPADCVQLVEDTTRDSAAKMMRLNGCLDLLIPRGGAGLIRSVVENATVPVIETGVGNCHIYVERTADLDMAVKIIVNAKTSRVSVCNAAESLLVDEAVAAEALPRIKKALDAYGVILYGCARTREILPEIECASEEDYGREYLDYKMSVKVVSGVDEAIAHINRYGTGHSEVIVTASLKAAGQFQQEVDAAAVYVNASSRFTDGGEFGFGAEIGISTQKLHARGPMGLSALTSYKYQITGDGQIR